MLSPEAAIQTPQRNVQKHGLPNGTTVLYSPNPYNRIVAVRILSRHASRHEARERAGIANIAMRMLSSGTDQHNEEEIAVLLERNGAHFKAESGKDWGSIDLLTTVDSLRHDLPILIELLDSTAYLEDKLARERELVRMNILEDEDSKLTYTMRLFNRNCYGDHPYAWPSIGTLSSVESLQREDVAAYGAITCSPGNLVVSAVGGAEESDVSAIIREAFAGRVSGAPVPLAPVAPPAPFPAEDRECVLHRETEAEYVILGYPGCSISDERAIVLRVISAILGGSMDSRLFREIRDKRGLCYQVGCSFAPHLDMSPLLIYTVTSPQNRNEAVQCAEAEIERLKTELVDEEELNRVKTYLTGTYVMSMESNMGQASRFGSYEVLGLGWDFANRFPAAIQSVTADAIRQTAQELFQHRLLAVTSPNVSPGAQHGQH